VSDVATDRARDVAAGRALLAVIDARTPPSLITGLVDGIDLDALLDAARVHRVVGVLHQRLDDAQIVLPAPVAARLAAARFSATGQQLVAYHALAAITAALGESFLVVKGPVLGAVWYGEPSRRQFSDIDVLVPRGQFARSVEALLDAGFAEHSANWKGFLDHRVAEIPIGAAGTTIDLHWDLVALGATRREIRWDMAPLFDRAETVELAPNVRVATLDPVDTLVHLCINGGLDGARRLGRLVDVHVVAGGGRIDWQQVVARARDAGVAGLCSAVLQRGATLVGTALPDGLLAELEPFPGWLRVNALVDRPRRGGRPPEDGVASGTLIASARDTRRRTSLQLSRKLAVNVLSRLGRPHLADTGGALDWQRVADPAQTARERDRYLRWVTGEGDSAGPR
jgi:hypothetical protein